MEGPVLGEQLNASQQEEIQGLLREYPEVVRDSPGRTTLAEDRDSLNLMSCHSVSRKHQGHFKG